MKQLLGQARVNIENIYPNIDGGRYLIKRVVGESVEVTADIFSDGQDLAKSEIIFRKKGEYKWQISPMHAVWEDHSKGIFKPDSEGIWEFTVRAWVDRFGTWQKHLIHRLQAGQDVEAEIKYALIFLKQASKKAMPKKAKRIEHFTEKIKNELDIEQAVKILFNQELINLINKYSDKDFASEGKLFEVLVERKKALFGSWYEFFPRSTGENGKHGTFKDAEKLIPTIAEWGFDTIYLPPIHPIGKTFRKGKNGMSIALKNDVGSCWAIGSKAGGHKSVHKSLGTLDDFRNFVKISAEHDIEICLDFALQCSPDHPYIQENTQWFNWKADGTLRYAENPPHEYRDIVFFDFENPDWQNLWAELKSIVNFWIDQGVKIFRVDNPHTKPFIFWEWLISEIKKEHFDVIFLAESFTKEKQMIGLSKLGFTQSYTYFAWRNSKDELLGYMQTILNFPYREHFRPHLWANTPDVLSKYLQFGGENGFVTRLILAATLSATYGIYGGAYENLWTHGNYGGEEYEHSEKFEIKHWDWKKPNRVKQVMKIVNKIRKENEALQYTHNLRFVEIDNPNMIAYLKTYENNKLLIVVCLDNFHSQHGWLNIPLEHLGIYQHESYKIKDLVTSSEYYWNGGRNYVELHPHYLPFHIFRFE